MQLITALKYIGYIRNIMRNIMAHNSLAVTVFFVSVKNIII